MARGDLLAGTVTFLFTDIEGSTRLLHELGAEDYAALLTEHRRVLRDAFGAHGGVEVDTQGDAFFYAFPTAAGALAAADRGRQALAAGLIRVRMSVHTGTPHLGEEGYVGADVHLGARIAACGHGGQVLVSKSTRDAVGDGLADLGEHRLKDFAEPVWIFQLGRERFPPLRTISNTNLPRPLSAFVGREQEKAELRSMLLNGSRLVTLSGPGGAGKTRLAVEVATDLVPEFRNGVYWVGLASLRDAALVIETIAQTLGAKDGVADYVGDRELLLLLDNFEQVVEAAPEVSAVITSCPNLRMLVTSRELLRVDGERDYPVPALAEQDAVSLFCDRSGLEEDETIADLCARLDELPLAIELAAARARVLSPIQILARLSERLDLLKGGRDADPRQQTLRATMEWSYELLDPDEKRLFASLSVFSGGCRLEAAEQICDAGLDTLQSLVDKSLVRHSGERFWMLETTREYAQEQLHGAGSRAELVTRHWEYFLRQAEESVAVGDDFGDEQLTFFRSERDNLRTALDRARDSGQGEIVLRLVAALSDYWHVCGFFREESAWCVLALDAASSPLSARVKVLRMACSMSMRDGDLAAAAKWVDDFRDTAERACDSRGVLTAMNSAAHLANKRGNPDGAEALWIELRERAAELGDELMQAFATINLSMVASRASDPRRTLAFATEAAHLFRRLGHETGLNAALANSAWAALELGDLDAAERAFGESLVIVDRLELRPVLATTAVGMAAILVAKGAAGRAARMLGAAAALREELGAELNDELEHRTQAKAIADAKLRLGDDGFASAWAQGQAMTPEEMSQLWREH